MFPSPWRASNQLVHIGIKGYELKSADRPRANLVLLVDVSGSMGPQDRLPLVKNGFRMLLDNLKPDDTVAIVTYASGSDVRLQPTESRATRRKILDAIDSLNAGGSTHGGAGHLGRLSGSRRPTSTKQRSTALSWRPTAIATSASPTEPS